jgi:hypothetical protein
MRGIPLGGFATKDEIADLALFLLRMPPLHYRSHVRLRRRAIAARFAQLCSHPRRRHRAMIFANLGLARHLNQRRD